MASLKDLIVMGPARFLDKLYGNLEGNATTATKLQTARTINGTSFDGSGNITTSYWGTARNFTIGNTTKSVNGSGNVAWTIAEIGAVNKAGDTMTGRLDMKPTGSSVEGGEILLGAAQSATTQAGIVLDNYNSTFRIFGQASADGTSKVGTGTPLVIDPYSKTITGGYSITGNASTATKLATPRTINGTSFDGSGNITTAYWGTTRKLTIGSTGKNVNGNADVSWSYKEIGISKNYTSFGTASANEWGWYTIATISDSATSPALFFVRAYAHSSMVFTVTKGYSTAGSLNILDFNASANGAYASVKGARLMADGRVQIQIRTKNSSDLATNTSVNIDINVMNSSNTLTLASSLVADDTASPSVIITRNCTTTGNIIAPGIEGNAATATKLKTGNTINGTNFDGSTAITTSSWGTTRTLTVGNKGQNVNGSSNVSWALHDILYNTSNIGTATSWDITTPGVYYVASSSAFTGTSNPEATNGGTTPYRYGQLIVSRANTGGMAQFYISHQDSNSTQTGLGIKFRTGWNSTYVGTWRTLMDSTNYTNWCDSRYINTAGDTMTGALNFANGVWNTMGDDAYIGDYNQAGMIGIKGKNGNTGIYFAPYSGSTAQTITTNGSGTMTISGTVAGTFSGNLSGNASTATKLGTSTIGSSTKPIYLSAGSPTAFSSTIGDTSTPVYLSGGSITVCNTFKNRPYSYNKGEVYYYTWGGSQDLNWKKVFAASHTATAPTTATYTGCTVKGIIYHRLGNYDQAEVREYSFVMHMGFLSNLSVSNSCVLRTSSNCPTTIIRAVRVSTNSFELQVRQPSDWQTMSVQFSVSGNCTNRSVFEPVNSSNTSALTNEYLQDSIPTRVVDAYNGTATTFAYSQSGMSSTNWLASWNGYELRAISPANVTAGKASALATSRYIFGRAFNGTADIAGKATVYGSYNATINSRYSTAALEIRENGLVATAQSDIAYAPQIGFHWSGRVAGQLALGSDAKFRFIKQDGNTATLIATLEGNASTATSATTATKLATARTIRTNLASTSTASFDGSSDITPGVTGTLPLGNGGTGVTSLNALRKLFREWAPIDSSNDTTSNWGAKGLSVAGYGESNTITDKPSTYGIVLNVNSADTEVHQLWFTQSSGRIFHRGGNGSGWNGSWRLMYSHGDSIIYSSSEPGSPVTGTIWLKPA